LLLLLCVCLSGFMLLAIDLYSCTLRRNGWARFASTFLLFYAQIILSEFLLGLFSLLTGLGLVILNLIISGALLYAIRAKLNRGVIKQYFSGLRAMPRMLIRTARTDPLWSILLTLAACFVAWIIFLGIIFPATDFDGNSYHLTFVGNAFQSHTFFDAPTSLRWLAGYPKGGEFIQMWSVLIGHNDLFTDITQLPFMILGVYALYTISITVGASKKNARFGSLLFLFLPIVLNQLKTTYVDVMLCSLFFAAIALILGRLKTKLDLLLLGIVFSLLVSVKSTGFLFIIVLLPLLLWALQNNNAIKSPGFKETYLRPLSYIALPTFFGLYWYFKDLIMHGSPLYPFGFKLAGHSIFPGQTFQEFAASAVNQSTSLPHGSVQRIWYVWTEQKDWFGCLYNYDTNYAGFGPIWFIILIPAFVAALYFAIKLRNRLFLAVAATIAFLFALYPSNYYTRYTIFVTALGFIGLSYTLTRISKLGANIIKCLAIILSLSVIGTNFVLCNFSPGVVKDQLSSVLKGSDRGVVYNNMPGPAFVFIENKERPGDTTAYDSSPYFIYPLWKPDFSNKVVYIPASNEAIWYKKLASQHVRYVFTTIGSKENRWSKDHLKSIYKDEMYEVYQTY